MSAPQGISERLWTALEAADLGDVFCDRDSHYEDCPACGGRKQLKLSLRTQQANCASCGRHGPLLAYLREREDPSTWDDEVICDAQIIPFDPAPKDQPPSKADKKMWSIAQPPLSAIEVQAVPPQSVSEEPLELAQHTSKGRNWSETLIVGGLALLFLAAGLAAAGLSGFANYQAFQAGVSDPLQARIWGWSGVIASVVSFGGFSLFWWHTHAGRWREGLRAAAFALAGAGTSIAGTSLYMSSHAAEQAALQKSHTETQALLTTQIADWSRQRDAIPPETRSVEGLKAYLAGVEAVGRTHQKPYRDAQNELGLAQRRAVLEANIEAARARQFALTEAPAPRTERRLPPLFFAIMLEVFASQGTSIACVCLLLLCGVGADPAYTGQSRATRDQREPYRRTALEAPFVAQPGQDS